jgi:hypothetical protein
MVMSPLYSRGFPAISPSAEKVLDFQVRPALCPLHRLTPPAEATQAFGIVSSTGFVYFMLMVMWTAMDLC